LGQGKLSLKIDGGEAILLKIGDSLNVPPNISMEANVLSKDDVIMHQGSK